MSDRLKRLPQAINVEMRAGGMDADRDLSTRDDGTVVLWVRSKMRSDRSVCELGQLPRQVDVRTSGSLAGAA